MSDPYQRFPDGIDDALLAAEPLAFLHALQRPTWIRFPGTGTMAPRAIATLLHGDESTGLEALLRVLRRRRRFPFDLHVVIGNVRAAVKPPGFAHRYLDDEEDFNRIWGAHDPTTMQRRAADGILGELRDAGLESLVDIHNTTGDNPFYAIVTRDRPETYNLATIFTTTLLRWDLGVQTLMESLEDRCAAIAVECGLPGIPESLAFAVDGLRRYLAAGPLVTDRVVRDFDLLGQMRKVIVRPEVRFRFGRESDLDDEVDLVLAAGGDVHNFVEVPAGHLIGWLHPDASLPVQATAVDGTDVTAAHFAVDDGRLVLTAPTTPIMMARTVDAVRKDCLFYLASGPPPIAEPRSSSQPTRSGRR